MTNKFSLHPNALLLCARILLFSFARSLTLLQFICCLSPLNVSLQCLIPEEKSIFDDKCLSSDCFHRNLVIHILHRYIWVETDAPGVPSAVCLQDKSSRHSASKQ